jgi:hypothetical protein
MAHKRIGSSARGGFNTWDRAEFGLLCVLAYPLFLVAVLGRRLALRPGHGQGVWSQALEETKSAIAIAFTG